MAMNDLLSDMLARVRNGQTAKLSSIQVQYSKFLMSVLDVLKREGYIRDYRKTMIDNKANIEVELKYHDGAPVIQKMSRVSTSGRREYSSISDLKTVNNGLGIAIISTSKGVLSDYEARQKNVGGEVLCNVL